MPGVSREGATPGFCLYRDMKATDLLDKTEEQQHDIVLAIIQATDSLYLKNPKAITEFPFSFDVWETGYNNYLENDDAPSKLTFEGATLILWEGLYVNTLGTDQWRKFQIWHRLPVLNAKDNVFDRLDMIALSHLCIKDKMWLVPLEPLILSAKLRPSTRIH